MSLYVDLSALLKRYVHAFAEDMQVFSIVELDETTCEAAAAQRVGGAAVPFLTFDVRQAQAARNLGLTVIGA